MFEERKKIYYEHNWNWPRKGILGFDSARNETRAKFFRAVFDLYLVVCSETKRERLLRRLIFLWIDSLAIINQK